MAPYAHKQTREPTEPESKSQKQMSNFDTLSNRKDEHAFSRALRAGQLEVLEGATHCTLEQDSLEAFRYYLLDWLRIVHPIAD